MHDSNNRIMASLAHARHLGAFLDSDGMAVAGDL